MIARANLPIIRTIQNIRSLTELLPNKQTKLTLRRSASTKPGDEIVFSPPRKAKYNTWTSARNIIQLELSRAEAFVQVCPANDWDAIRIELMTKSLEDNKPFIFVLPERSLIPHPYWKIIQEIQGDCKDFKHILFLHSDDSDIKNKITEHLQGKERIVWLEVDFPHSPISLKSHKQVEQNCPIEITPDYNLRDIVKKCLEEKEVFYVGIDHHTNSKSEKFIKESGNGVFFNNHYIGACALVLQELMHKSFFSNLKELFKTNKTKESLQNTELLIKKCQEYTLSAISSDFYINILLPQFKSKKPEVIKDLILEGTLHFPEVTDLINTLKYNPHFIHVLFPVNSDSKKEVISLLNEVSKPWFKVTSQKRTLESKMRELHYLLAEHLYMKGKELIEQNDLLVQEVIQAQIHKFTQESESNYYKSIVDVINNLKSFPLKATKLVNEAIVKLIENFPDSNENKRDISEQELIQTISKWIPQNLQEPFFVIDRQTEIGKFLMSVSENTTLSIDDIRRWVSSILVKHLLDNPKLGYLTLVFPLTDCSMGVVCKRIGDANNQHDPGKVIAAMHSMGCQGGGNKSSGAGIIPDQRFSQSLTMQEALRKIHNQTAQLA